MTAREYRRLTRNFARQSRLDLPYSPSRVGLAPRLAAAWREYWRPDLRMGVPADTQIMVTLCGFGLLVLAAAGIVAECCGF